jgi:hypothetical protein
MVNRKMNLNMKVSTAGSQATSSKSFNHPAYNLPIYEKDNYIVLRGLL